MPCLYLLILFWLVQIALDRFKIGFWTFYRPCLEYICFKLPPFNKKIHTNIAVSICTRILKYRVWKIKFDELDFLSISNSNFAGCTGSKNLDQTRQKFQFIKLHFSNSTFQNPSADRYRDIYFATKTFYRTPKRDKNGLVFYKYRRSLPNATFGPGKNSH